PAPSAGIWAKRHPNPDATCIGLTRTRSGWERGAGSGEPAPRPAAPRRQSRLRSFLATRSFPRRPPATCSAAARLPNAVRLIPYALRSGARSALRLEGSSLERGLESSSLEREAELFREAALFVGGRTSRRGAEA